VQVRGREAAEAGGKSRAHGRLGLGRCTLIAARARHQARDLPSNTRPSQPGRLTALEADLGIEDELARRDAPHGVPEAVHVGDAILEQIADALFPALETLLAVARNRLLPKGLGQI